MALLTRLKKAYGIVLLLLKQQTNIYKYKNGGVSVCHSAMCKQVLLTLREILFTEKNNRPICAIIRLSVNIISSMCT